MRGHVVWFDAVRAYGFITGDDRQTYFVHRTAVLDGAPLETGERVEFDATETPRGLRAEAVRRISSIRVRLAAPRTEPAASSGPLAEEDELR